MKFNFLHINCRNYPIPGWTVVLIQNPPSYPDPWEGSDTSVQYSNLDTAMQMHDPFQKAKPCWQ